MRTVHLIHGFNERHDIQQPKLACLAPWLRNRGLSVMVHDYGHWDLIATRNNENLARLIYPHVRPGDSIIAFSNGAAITAHLQAMDVVAPKIVFVQPAIKKDWVPNRHCEDITVFWNPGDTATIGGKWYRRATSILPWRWQARHNWGEMGHTGFTGDDDRYVQVQTDDTHGMPVASGHAAWAKTANRQWRKAIADYA